MEKIHCIGIGLGGFSAEIGTKHYGNGSSTKSTLSGYDRDPARIVADLATAPRHGGKYDINGAVVIDKRSAVDTDDGVKIVFKAPMLDLDAPRAFNPSDVSPILAAGLSQPGNAYGGILAMALAGQLNLDSVNLEGYTQYWREAGARIGKVVNGAIEWESTK